MPAFERQQINLYLPEFRPRREWLSARYSAAYLGMILLVLVAMTALDRHKIHSAERRLVQMDAHAEALRARANHLKSVTDTRKRDVLTQQLAQTQTALRNREAVLHRMQGQTLGNSGGFSAHFMALGQHRVEGVSLQAFALERGGLSVRLEGVAQKPERVPQYLTRLQSDPNFQQSTFGPLSLRARDQGVHFLLGGDGTAVDKGAGMDKRAAAKEADKW